MSNRNFLGALDWSVGEDDIGAHRTRRSGGGYGSGHGGGRGNSAAYNRHAMAQQRANHAASFTMPDVPGVPSRDAALLPSAFAPLTFAAADGVNIKPTTMQPQCPFRGQRLTGFVLRNGASALLTAPAISTLQVGMKPIITTLNPVALETFNQNAFDVNLLFPPTQPGVVYQMNVALLVALANADTILVLCTVIGSAVL